MLRPVCKQDCVQINSVIGAASFLLKCSGRSTKRRSKVLLHFNKGPGLSSLMLCCHALQLQRNSNLVTENCRKRYRASPHVQWAALRRRNYSTSLSSKLLVCYEGNKRIIQVNHLLISSQSQMISKVPSLCIVCAQLVHVVYCTTVIIILQFWLHTCECQLLN